MISANFFCVSFQLCFREWLKMGVFVCLCAWIRIANIKWIKKQQIHVLRFTWSTLVSTQIHLFSCSMFSAIKMVYRRHDLKNSLDVVCLSIRPGCCISWDFAFARHTQRSFWPSQYANCFQLNCDVVLFSACSVFSSDFELNIFRICCTAEWVLFGRKSS